MLVENLDVGKVKSSAKRPTKVFDMLQHQGRCEDSAALLHRKWEIDMHILLIVIPGALALLLPSLISKAQRRGLRDAARTGRFLGLE